MSSFRDTLGSLSPKMQGFIVSLIMLTAGAPGIYGGQLADKFGVPLVVACGAMLYLIGSIMEGAAFTLPVFIVGRAVTGVGLGLWLSNVNK